MYFTFMPRISVGRVETRAEMDALPFISVSDGCGLRTLLTVGQARERYRSRRRRLVLDHYGIHPLVTEEWIRHKIKEGGWERVDYWGDTVTHVVRYEEDIACTS